jgi:DNA invertase Pin-like site-specific DNA recombinase
MADAIYLRKSRKDMEAEAHGEGETLARHRAALLANAQRLGRTVTEIYAEVVSGDSIAARPEMQRLLADVEAGKYDAVHVMEVERLARGDSLDQGLVARAFKYSGTLIITPLKTYDPNDEYDEEYFEFGLFMSRRELKTITRRQQRGRVASVQEGKWPFNMAPFGYSRAKLEGQKGWTLAEDPARAEIVRSIFRWYTEGAPLPDGTTERLGVSRIARRLNESRIPSRTGKDWTPAVIRDVLSNPVYAGWVRWGFRPGVKKIVDGHVVISSPRADPASVTMARGLHPALVSQEMFDAAQEYLARNKSRPGPKQMAMKNPLSGLVICSGCGRAMVRRPYGSGYPDSLICPYTSCHTVGSNLATVEKELLAAMRLWLAEMDAGDPAPSRFEDELRLVAQNLDSLRADLEKHRAQLGRAYELVEQGVYTPQVFLSRSRALSEKIEETERSIADAEKEQTRLQLTIRSESQQLPRLRHVLDSYTEDLSPEQKNALLRSVLEKVEYTKTNRERWGDGSDLSLRLFPKLPFSSALTDN